MIKMIENKNSVIKTKLIILFFFIAISFANAGDEPRIRPANWAQPIIGTTLENFYIIDSTLYRSSQPGKSEFIMLEKLGIKEVLNLRHYHSDIDEIKGTNLKIHQVKMDAAKIKLAEIIETLKIIKKAKGPVLIHCKHGSDRTGAITAMYRIIFQNWTKEEAIDELINGGYGFHKIYKNIIEFIEKVNIEEIKKSVNP